MATLTERFERVKPRLTMADLAIDAAGKFLLGFGVGALAAEAMAPWAWWFVGGGFALSLIVKARHLRTFWS